MTSSSPSQPVHLLDLYSLLRRARNESGVRDGRGKEERVEGERKRERGRERERGGERGRERERGGEGREDTGRFWPG